MVRFFDVCDALTTLMQARTGYRAASEASTDTLVTNGPTLTDSEFKTLPSGLIIGWSFSGSETGTFEQEFGPMNAATRPRDETGFVLCTAFANNGRLQSVADGRVETILSDIEALTRSNPELSLNSPTHTGFRWTRGPIQARIERPTGNGAQCRVEFAIEYSTRHNS